MNMNELNKFMNKQNVSLLWDVIVDEFNITNNDNDSTTNMIKTIFESNLKPFILRANPNINVIDLNKQFLSQVVLAVNKLVPKRIQISNEDVLDQPYKIEDIHASRQNNFQYELEQKKNEMELYLTPNKPKEMDFSDKIIDNKITQMDALIADKLAERDRDIGIQPPKKVVTFDNNNSNDNIFNKLKRTTITEPNITQYETQQSVSLPKVETEIIPQQTNNVKNDFIIPKNEIIEIIKMLVDRFDKFEIMVNNMETQLNDIKTNISKIQDELNAIKQNINK